MLIHYHIPKTAGTSVKRVLEAWYPNLVREADHDRKTLVEVFRGPDTCITGHFAARLRGHKRALLNMLPQLKCAHDLPAFTILREPLEHAVSSYYHLRKIGKHEGELLDFLYEGNPYRYRNSLSLHAAETIPAVLNSFVVVGDAAQLQASMDLLADRLVKPRLEVPFENVGDRDPQLISLTRRDRSRLTDVYRLDYELYEQARDRLAGNGTQPAPSAIRQFAYAFAVRVRPAPEAPASRSRTRRKRDAALRQFSEAFEVINRQNDLKLAEQMRRAETAQRQATDLMQLLEHTEAEKAELVAIIQRSETRNAELSAMLKQRMIDRDTEKQDLVGLIRKAERRTADVASASEQRATEDRGRIQELAEGLRGAEARAAETASAFERHAVDDAARIDALTARLLALGVNSDEVARLQQDLRPLPGSELGGLLQLTRSAQRRAAEISTSLKLRIAQLEADMQLLLNRVATADIENAALKRAIDGKGAGQLQAGTAHPPEPPLATPQEAPAAKLKGRPVAAARNNSDDRIQSEA